MKSLDIILKDKSATKWIQRDIAGLAAAECATDSIRAAIRPIDAAPEGRTVTGGAQSTPPNLAAIWPDKATLPNKIRFSAFGVAFVKALAPLSVALRSDKKKAQTFTMELESEEDTKALRVRVNWYGGRGSFTIPDSTMEGPPIRFNAPFLADALYENGSTVHYESCARPALIDHETAPILYPISILMPVTPVR